MTTNMYRLISAVEAKFIECSSQQYKDFLRLLLHGSAKYPGLYHLSKAFSAEDCHHLEIKIQEQLKCLSVRHFRFRFFLSGLLKNISQIRGIYQLMLLGQKRKHPLFSETFAKRQDFIYQQTAERFFGKTIVPVIQSFDFRLGGSHGECGGYVLSWLKHFIDGRYPFGINPEQTSFQPILMNSKIGQYYPDLNHCIPLTKEASFLQHRLSKRNILQSSIVGPIWKNSICCLAELELSKLIHVLASTFNDLPEVGLYLLIRSHDKAHAIGIYKSNATIHIIDVNIGWFAFKEQHHFFDWLIFYFQKMRYDQTYQVFSIDHYNLHGKPRQSQNQSTQFFHLMFVIYLKKLKQCLHRHQNQSPQEDDCDSRSVVIHSRFFRTQSLPNLSRSWPEECTQDKVTRFSSVRRLAFT